MFPIRGPPVTHAFVGRRRKRGDLQNFNENLTKQYISENLHFTSPHINELKNLWFSQYDHLSFVDLKFGSEAKSLTDFHQSVVESADSIRDILGTFQIIAPNSVAH